MLSIPNLKTKATHNTRLTQWGLTCIIEASFLCGVGTSFPTQVN